jgi:hypothetical protein
MRNCCRATLTPRRQGRKSLLAEFGDSDGGGGREAATTVAARVRLMETLFNASNDVKITVDLCNHTEYNRPDLAYRRSLEDWK